LIFQ